MPVLLKKIQVLSEMVVAHIFPVLNENENEWRDLVQLDQLLESK